MITTKILAVLFLFSLAGPQFFRSNYETARITNRTTSLSYDEALVVAPAAMDNFARYKYETTRKANGPPSLPYDEALVFSRSG